MAESPESEPERPQFTFEDMVELLSDLAPCETSTNKADRWLIILDRLQRDISHKSWIEALAASLLTSRLCKNMGFPQQTQSEFLRSFTTEDISTYFSKIEVELIKKRIEVPLNTSRQIPFTAPPPSRQMPFPFQRVPVQDPLFLSSTFFGTSLSFEPPSADLKEDTPRFSAHQMDLCLKYNVPDKKEQYPFWHTQWILKLESLDKMTKDHVFEPCAMQILGDRIAESIPYHPFHFTEMYLHKCVKDRQIDFRSLKAMIQKIDLNRTSTLSDTELARIEKRYLQSKRN